jgi:hypothetical protein
MKHKSHHILAHLSLPFTIGCNRIPTQQGPRIKALVIPGLPYNQALNLNVKLVHIMFSILRWSIQMGVGMALACTMVQSSMCQTNCATSSPGLIGWWRAEGNALDTMGTGNGTAVGGVAYVPGVVGQAFSFNGVNGAVNIPDSLAFALTNSLSIEGWIYVTNPPAVLGEVLFRGDTKGSYPYSVSVRSDDGKLTQVGFDVTDTSNNVASLSSVIATGAWVHVAATLEATNGLMSLYTNGIIAAEITTAVRPFGPLDPAFGPGLGIGNYSSQPGPFPLPFRGAIDELSLYNRALTPAEILAIVVAGSAGKCIPPPTIVSQPLDQTVTVGGTANFSVLASGVGPLSYQWRYNGTGIDGATKSSLSLPGVQLYQAGTYSVQVTNGGGGVASRDAVLTVTVPPNCVPDPSGLVAWWPGEGDANDVFGRANGVIYPPVSFATGKVKQCFSFDGTGGGVNVPDVPILALSNSLSIECWMFVTNTPTSPGMIIFRGDSRSGLDPYLIAVQPDDNNNTLNFAITGPAGNSASIGVPTPLGAWTHVAATLEDATGIMRLYTNAVIAGEITTSVRPLGPLDPGSNPGVGIGNHPGQPAYWNYPFTGKIDELSVYNRALTQAEIQAIYAGGALGKCAPPIIIVTQPTNQTVYVGENATFNVVASGVPPLSYQWLWNSNNVPGETNSSLGLTNVQFSQAGYYRVSVSGSTGTTNSTNAILTVLPPPPCSVPPTNLISWWRGETNTLDQVGPNIGTLIGNVSYAPGRVGLAFSLDGTGDGIRVGNPPDLQLQSFSIEGWVKRSSASVVSFGSGGNGAIFAFGAGGYAFFLDNNGLPALGRLGIDQVKSTVRISNLSFHHLAVTKSNATVTFYIDGVASAPLSYTPQFAFTTSAAIGARGDTLDNSFYGLIDELSIYGRALSSNEIQGIYAAAISGKCLTPVPPFIIKQPVGLNVVAGSNVTFNVLAGGSVPFGYQWRFNGTNISGATTSSLNLPSIQVNQSGSYSVLLTNLGGMVASSNAVLAVAYPPVQFRLGSTNTAAGGRVTVPVVIVCNGNENALGCSINFDTAKLAYSGASLASGFPGANLILNTSQVNSGRLGISAMMPVGSVFPAGTQLLAQVSFVVAVLTNSAVATNTFGDIPTPRQLWDTQLNSLPASYSNGTVVISAATSFEGDIFPRPGGDWVVTLSDWLQMGRYVAHLDYPTNSSEFQRADNAPRMTLGDGAITIGDWVQVGRYAFGWDPLTPAGGPTNEVAYSGAGPSAVRIVNAGALELLQGNTGVLAVTLAAQGDENGLGFSVVYDPTLVSFTGASLGADASDASLFVNSSQAASGRVGFALVLATGNTFKAGKRELVKLAFTASSTNSGAFSPAFGDIPVIREVANTLADALPASYASSGIVVNPIPTLSIAVQDTNVLLNWQATATNFVLQQAELEGLVSMMWTNISVVPIATNGQSLVELPLSEQGKLYRLRYVP